MLTPQQQEAVRRIAAAAVACEVAIGCPAELTAAQCIFESGYLSHAPGNNAFGIKAHAGVDEQYLSTAEWLTESELEQFLRGHLKRRAELRQPVQQVGNRKLYDCLDAFAAYSTLADCFSDHARLIQCGAYSQAWAAYQADHDLDRYIAGVAAHYATDPEYARRISSEAHSSTVQLAVQAVRQAVVS
jgi:flagellum-specific peptidoglycan hydrolase FlgJ